MGTKKDKEEKENKDGKKRKDERDKILVEMEKDLDNDLFATVEFLSTHEQRVEAILLQIVRNTAK